VREQRAGERKKDRDRDSWATRNSDSVGLGSGLKKFKSCPHASNKDQVCKPMP
jgi:hypothetical protein